MVGEGGERIAKLAAAEEEVDNDGATEVGDPVQSEAKPDSEPPAKRKRVEGPGGRSAGAGCALPLPSRTS